MFNLTICTIILDIGWYKCYQDTTKSRTRMILNLVLQDIRKSSFSGQNVRKSSFSDQNVRKSSFSDQNTRKSSLSDQNALGSGFSDHF